MRNASRISNIHFIIILLHGDMCRQYGYITVFTVKYYFIIIFELLLSENVNKYSTGRNLQLTTPYSWSVWDRFKKASIYHCFKTRNYYTGSTGAAHDRGSGTSVVHQIANIVFSFVVYAQPWTLGGESSTLYTNTGCTCTLIVYYRVFWNNNILCANPFVILTRFKSSSLHSSAEGMREIAAIRVQCYAHLNLYFSAALSIYDIITIIVSFNRSLLNEIQYSRAII